MRDDYVYGLYEIVNGDSNLLYIGKGKGKRVFQHRLNVERKMNRNERIYSKKEKAIAAAILNKTKGSELKELIIGRYKDGGQAYAVEATLIKWVYGLGDLKNEKSGNHSDTIRTKGNMDYDDKLDRQLTTREHGQQRVEDNDLDTEAKNLSESLEEYGIPNVKMTGFETGGQDYTLSWTVPDTLCRLQLKLQLSSRNIVINARPTHYTGKNQNRVEFENLVEEAGYVLSNKTGEVFAALFESNYSPFSINEVDNKARAQCEALNGFSGTRLGSHYKGIPIENVEEIVRWMQDFQIRLILANQIIELKRNPQENTSILASLEAAINIFRHRPESKYWLKGQRPKGVEFKKDN
ncbi:MAG: hypothetical protein QM483_13695 [Desulfuromusa sp.]